MSSPVRLTLASTSEIVLCRGDKQNAMNWEMAEAIADAAAEVRRNKDVRLVLVRGEGRAFCAGGDFDMLERNTEQSPEQNRRSMLAFYTSFLSVLRIEVPTIAVVHGAAVGAGLCLAMACDLRIARAGAKLGANFVRVGLHPGMACTLLLPRLVGAARARELLISGRLIRGTEAAEIGLVHEAVEQEQLEQRVADHAAEICAGSPAAQRQLKATLMGPIFAQLDATLQREAACQALNFASADLKEAVAAFKAGRAPIFAVD